MRYTICSVNGHLYRPFVLRGETVARCTHCGLIGLADTRGRGQS